MFDKSMKDEKLQSLKYVRLEDYEKSIEAYINRRFARLVEMHADGSLFAEGTCPFFWVFVINDLAHGEPYESILDEGEIKIKYGGLEHGIKIEIKEGKIFASLLFELGGTFVRYVYNVDKEYRDNVEKLKMAGLNVFQGLVEGLREKGIDIEMGEVRYA